MSHCKCSFNVPIAYNDGRPVEPEVIGDLEAELDAVFFGFTIEGERTGVWRGQREVSAWYTVYVLPQEIDTLRQIVRKLGSRLGQAQMAFEVGTPTAELLDIDDVRPPVIETDESPKKKRAKRKKEDTTLLFKEHDK